MSRTTLAQLYAEHRGRVSDKWSLYLSEYNRIFDEYRDRPVRLLEIGVQNGGSLEIWSKFFPYAQKLVGCDINPDCARLHYKDPRIAVVIGDTNADAAEEQILGYAPEFDVIIDDGSHCSSDIVKSFARYFPHLADGGVFVVEDLHCSYWEEYGGGLFDPISSITFFKRLVDIVNFEHRGLDISPSTILELFESQYGIQLDENLLSYIHSLEFTNSLCSIRKKDPSQNVLGQRVIAGIYEGIVAGYLSLKGSSCPVSPQDQKRFEKNQDPSTVKRELKLLEIQIALLNQTVAERDAQIDWLNQAMSERDTDIAWLNQAVSERDTQIALLNQTVAERDAQIDWLNQAMSERDTQIALLNQTVAERDAQIAWLNQAMSERDTQMAGLLQSRSWRVTWPLRFMRRQFGLAKRFFAI